jgi:hypothetical protein
MTSGAKMQEVGWGFHGLLVCFGVFLMLRWMILKKVQGCCPYLVSNSSHRGGGAVQVGHPALCIIHCRWMSAWHVESWFGKVLPYLGAKPLLGGVAALTGPHAAIVRQGLRALGQMLPGLSPYVGWC